MKGQQFFQKQIWTVVGTLAGGDGDSGDDLGIFDPLNWVTYSYDNHLTLETMGKSWICGIRFS